MKKLVNVLVFFIVLLAQFSLAQESGIELLGYSKKISPPISWTIYEAKTNQYITTVRNRWGLVNVAPGRYKVKVQFSGVTGLDYPDIVVPAKKIVPLVLDSGIKIRGPSKAFPAPNNWELRHLKTNKRITSTNRQWNTNIIPPGEYSFSALFSVQGVFVNFGNVKIKAGKIKTINLDSGVELQGLTAQSAQPKMWYLNDPKTGRRVASVRNGWGHAIVPPGNYRLDVEFPGQLVKAYRMVNVAKGKITPVVVDTGITLTSPSPGFQPPRRWQLLDYNSKKIRTTVTKRWGFAAVPAGDYQLKIVLADGSEVVYGKVSIVESKINHLALDAGLDLTGTFSEAPKKLQIYDASTQKVVFKAKHPLGFIPLAEGRYLLNIEGENIRGWSSTIDVRPNEIVTLDTAMLGFSPSPFTKVFDHHSISGFNIAGSNLGGRIVEFSSEKNNTLWAASNLNDGFLFLDNKFNSSSCDRTCGWLSESRQIMPHEFTIAFHKKRQAKVAAVIINTSSKKNEDATSKAIPQHLEIWGTRSKSPKNFFKITSTRLQRVTGPQLIELASSVEARFIKIRLLSSYGADNVSLGEVKVIEDPQAPSILSTLPIDLIHPQNDGAIVWFTSQSSHHLASQTMWDNGESWSGEWRSAYGPYGRANHLPQNIVYGFRGDQHALVEYIEFDLSGIKLSKDGKYGLPALAKTFSVAISQESPVEGFEEVGKFLLAVEPLQQRFEINRKARFIKLSILDTQGESSVAKLAKVRIVEGKEPGYVSILRRKQDRPIRVSPVGDEFPAKATALSKESEPNDSPSTANPLPYNRWTTGILSPSGDRDNFRLSVAKPGIINIHAYSEPFLDSQIEILHPQRGTRYQFPSERMSKSSAALSLQVEAGDHLVKLTQPKNSIVLVWDASRSMRGSEKDLKNAVMNFIRDIGPSEQVNLISFGDKVETLLPNFTHDVKLLTEAANDKFDPDGSTALYDAIQRAAKLLETTAGNGAIVVMTDGQDSSSQLKHPGLWKLLQQSKIRIYSVGLGYRLEEYSRDFGASGERLLNHMAMATGGRSFHAASSSELNDLYQNIANELRTPSPYFIKPTLNEAPGILDVVSNGQLISRDTLPTFQLILDASGSMRQGSHLIDGRLKIDAAKEILSEVVNELPQSSKVSFRVFGQRVAEYAPGDCEDSELIYPLSTLNKVTLKNLINDVTIKNGTTPLSYSLVQAAKDMARISGEKLVILVTDGEEYCGADPEAVIRSLRNYGIPMRVEVVGLSIASKRTQSQMQKISDMSGGKFYNVKSTDMLRKALYGSMGASFDVLDDSGEIIASGHVDRGPIQLPPGAFTLRINSQKTSNILINIEVEANQLTRAELNIANGKLDSVISKLSTYDENLQRWLNTAVRSKPLLDKEGLIKALQQLEEKVLQDKRNRPKRGQVVR